VRYPLHAEITEEEFQFALGEVLTEIYGRGAAMLAESNGDIWAIVREKYNNEAIDKAHAIREDGDS
jgi:hypothetical protein